MLGRGHMDCIKSLVDRFAQVRYTTNMMNRTEQTMTAQELIAVLAQLDPNKEILIYDGSWDTNKPISEVKIDQDGEVVIW